jgi:hypothetical protein
MEKKDIETAVASFRDGARPFGFRRPNWYFVADDGNRYPLKYIFAMALGIDSLDTHTDEAKKCIQSYGYQIEKDVEGDAFVSFWWVNHKQTHLDEYAGGYIWSPKTKKNGSSNEGYLNLTRAKVGDRVISYANGVIKSIGVVTYGHIEAPIPKTHWEAAQYWGESGWQVSVEWVLLKTPLRPKDFLDRIVPLLPGKHSPIQKNGDGNQGCYLARISTELGNLVLNLIREVDPTAAHTVHEVEIEAEEALQEQILQTSEIPETEKQQLVRSRIGQGIFRIRVAQQEKKCRLTGVDNLAFLVASHIKPWRDSNNEERLSGSNGLLLSPHVDKLFDRGWISFSDDGKVLISEQAKSVVQAWGLALTPNVGAFDPMQRIFLKHHREKVFKGA